MKRLVKPCDCLPIIHTNCGSAGVSRVCSARVCEYQITCTIHLLQVDVNAYGIDWDGPAPSEEWDGIVEDDSTIVEVPERLHALDS